MINKSLYFAVFVISMFLMTSFNQVVSADVVEVEKIVHIETGNAGNYSATFNIVNSSNNQYTNEQILVKPFEENSTVTGMISGSFLPPAKFQLPVSITGVNPTANNHLLLASTVQFQKKNLLSGASSSWWRCPYYYNGTDSVLPHARDFTIYLSIWHVDLPRTANITFKSGAYTPSNYATIYPQSIANPSLVFQRTYTNAGQTRNKLQDYFTRTYTYPVNDTLVDPERPLNLTNPASPEYNPYKYNTSITYSHAWVNVSAPIYPNETYFVLWNIYDANMGIGDAASCWVSSTDIGNDGYGRTLISWNGKTIYEIPIDLDTTVIFQTGMGAGVSGMKLDYTPTTVTDLTPYFTNMNFEDTWGSKQWTYGDTMATDIYTKYWSDTNIYTKHTTTGTDGQIDFMCNRTGKLINGGLGADGTSDGTFAELRYGTSTYVPERVNMWFDVSLHDILTYRSGSDYDYGAQFKIGLHHTLGERARVVIQKFESITAGVSTVYNNLLWYDGTGTYQTVSLPNTMSNNLYVNIYSNLYWGFLFGVPYPIRRMVVTLYDQDNPHTILYSLATSGVYSGGVSYGVVYSGAAINRNMVSSTYNTLPITNQPAVTIRAITGINATKKDASIAFPEFDEVSIPGWTFEYPTGYSYMHPSLNNYAYPMDTIVPEKSASNFRCMSFIQTHPSNTKGFMYQTSVKLPPKATPQNYWIEGYYRMIENIPTTGGDYFQLYVVGQNFTSGTSKTVYQNFNMKDGAWHKISAYSDTASTGITLSGNFDILSIYLRVYTAWNSAIKYCYFDNFKAYCRNVPTTYHNFIQPINRNSFNATNYYTLMIPFKNTNIITQGKEPTVGLSFRNSAGSITNTFFTQPTDFNDEFLIWSIRTSSISTLATYVVLYLYVYQSDMYIFLHDRNSNFQTNNATSNRYNSITSYTPSTTNYTYFSPYYSLKTTEGRWLNADSQLTTTYFYYVVTRYYRFNDNDPEMISIMIDTVDVQDLEAYRLSLKAFGTVYDAAEWKSYLEYLNRPSLTDKIGDFFYDLFKWFVENTWLGQILYALGKMIYEEITFLAPYLESLGAYILEAVVFIIAIVVFFIATWVMWNFVSFWILLAQGRVEEAIQKMSSIANKTTELIQKGSSIAKRVASSGVMK